MFAESADFEETYFSAELETTPTNQHHIVISYFEGTDSPTAESPTAGVGLEIRIYETNEKVNRIGYAAKKYPESTIRHNRTLTERILGRVVRQPPTSFEKFLEYKIQDAYATTRMTLVTGMLDTIVEKTITQLEVKGAFQKVAIDIWEEYNMGEFED